MVFLAPTTKVWVCPNCDVRAGTPVDVPNRFHTCVGLAGLTAPLVPEGTNCKLETTEREDYIGEEHPQLDGNGRPVMNVTITRDDGEDVAVYAPTATLGVQV